MSADNWTICPKCRVDAKEEYNRRMASAKASYGVVSEEEYLKAVADAKKGLPIGEESLCEYYEIFMKKEGKLYINYSGSCTKCNWSFSFKREIDVFLPQQKEADRIKRLEALVSEAYTWVREVPQPENPEEAAKYNAFLTKLTEVSKS